MFSKLSFLVDDQRGVVQGSAEKLLTHAERGQWHVFRKKTAGYTTLLLKNTISLHNRRVILGSDAKWQYFKTGLLAFQNIHFV